MKNYRNVFAASVFVYLILATLSFHPDLKTIFYQSQYLGKGILNIYRFFLENPEKSFLGPFVYPPLAYFLFGILFFPIKFLSGNGFVDWIAMGNDAVGVPHIFRYIFFMKLPLVIVHLVTGAFLAQLVNDKKKRIFLLLVWFFNPISLYVVSLMGQFDGIVAFLTVLALLWVERRPFRSALLLGIGGAIKSYPLLLLPFLAIVRGNSLKDKVKLFIAGLAPYLFVILPFTKTKAFYQDTLISGLSQRIFQANIPIGFEEKILLIPAFYLILLLVAFYKHSGNSKALFNYFLAVPLLILSGTHFHPQWTMWALPFVSIALAQKIDSSLSKILLPGIMFFLSWVGIIFLFNDKFLTWGLISPIDPGVLFLPTPVTLIERFIDTSLLQSLAHTTFAVSAFWIIREVFQPINE